MELITGLLAENGETIQYEDLDLTEEIIQETKSWLGWYWDSFYDLEDFPLEDFKTKGFEIAKKLKSYLGNSYRVYFDHREIACNEEGEFEIEHKNQLELVFDKLSALQNKLDVELSDEDEEAQSKLLDAIFIEKLRELPTISKLHDFELKDVTPLENNGELWGRWEDYQDDVLTYFNEHLYESFKFYSFDDIAEYIRDNHADEIDYDKSDNELVLDYMYYANKFIEDFEKKIDRIYNSFKDNYGDSYESKSLFYTAYESDYLCDYEGINKIRKIIAMHPEKLVSHRELVVKAEEIAKEAHRRQPYGTHRNDSDYYLYHLDEVRKTAKILSKKLEVNTFKIEIVALLHDLFEDTSYPEDEINSLFGDDITNSIKLLSFHKTQSEEEYLERISNDELAKVVKAADRVSNVSKLLEVKDIEKRKKLFKKYLGQYPLFKNYNIFPEKIEEAFTSLVI